MISLESYLNKDFPGWNDAPKVTPSKRPINTGEQSDTDDETLHAMRRESKKHQRTLINGKLYVEIKKPKYFVQGEHYKGANGKYYAEANDKTGTPKAPPKNSRLGPLGAMPSLVSRK